MQHCLNNNFTCSRHVTIVALFLDDNKTNDDEDSKENGKK